MTDQQLRTLLSELKSKDPTALEALYDELSVPVFTIALRITKSRVLAEDTVQEVFLKLYSTPPEKELKKPRAYILRMAHNKALDMLRENPQTEDIDKHDELPAEEAHCSDVSEALSKLSGELRSIVTLHINGGLKFREIAEIMSLPLGTVLWKYRKALSQMKQFLTD